MLRFFGLFVIDHLENNVETKSAHFLKLARRIYYFKNMSQMKSVFFKKVVISFLIRSFNRLSIHSHIIGPLLGIAEANRSNFCLFYI